MIRYSSQQVFDGIPIPDFPEDSFSCSDTEETESPLLSAPLPQSKGPQTVITPKELAEMITNPNKFNFDKLLIIDARFEYEFRGGRIVSAINVRSKSQLYGIYNRYLKQNVFIVFHCEFSQKRGPTLFQLFREYDRHHNTYPNLSYPNVFLLEGGYKKFYEQMPQLCIGGYTPMRDERFVNSGDLRKSHSFFTKEMLQQKKSSHPGRRLQRSCSQSVQSFSFFDTSASLPGFLTYDDEDSNISYSASQGSF